MADVLRYPSVDQADGRPAWVSSGRPGRGPGSGHGPLAVVLAPLIHTCILGKNERMF